MGLNEKLVAAKLKVSELLTKGHTACVEEVYKEGELSQVIIHHYPMCRQCVKEREVENGKEK